MTEDLPSYAECTSSPESYTTSVPDFSNFSLGTPHEVLAQPQGCDVQQDPTGCLRELANRTPSQLTPTSSAIKGRKRNRGSDDLNLQRHVRKLMASRSQTDSMVPADQAVAETCLLPSASEMLLDMPEKAAQSPTRISSYRLPLQKDMGRKRACCGEEAAKALRDRRPGPGMWDGIL